MTITLIVSVATCLGMILSVLFKPSIKIKNVSFGLYWVITLLGALIIVISGLLPINDLILGLTSNSTINPIKILVLFLSMTVLSIFLDEVGFFKYLANETLKRAKTSQKSLFVYLYVVVSILTVFTSNDIIILTFTPFICYFSKNAKINPIPYLIAEFVAANTWSMALIIGNPTNIYLSAASGIQFVEYLSIMILPTIFGGLTAFLILFLLFKKTLSQEFSPSFEEVKIKDKPLLIIGIIHLSLCTILLAISGYINLDMWIITLCFAISLYLFVLLFKLIKKQKPTELWSTSKRVPWQLIPFVLSMFVIVLALNKNGITLKISELLGKGNLTILKYGFSSFLFSNIINNIPMSVLYSSVLSSLDGEFLFGGVYATIVGSNLGAILTPIGALAGIMWSSILKNHEVKFSFIKFIGYGVIIAIPSLIATLGGLYLTLGLL